MSSDERLGVSISGTRELYSKIDSLTGKDLKKAILSSLRSSASILRRETDKQFKSRVKLGKSYSKSKNGKAVIGKRSIARVVIDKKNLSAKVHIMDDFRAKFFELGTKKRYTRQGFNRKPAYRGSIEAGYHFRKAQEITRDKIFNEMSNGVGKAIDKIYNRR